MARNRVYGMITSPRTLYSFKRTVCAGLKLNASTGFTTYAATGAAAGGFNSGLASVSPGIGIQFSLQGMTITGNQSSGYNMPNAAEFTALFDSWRISKIVLKIMYSANINTTSNPTLCLPIVQHCPDQDDATPPALPNELLQRPEMKVVEYGAGSQNLIKYFTIYPQAKLATDPTGVTATTSAPRSVFFDCSESGVINYGFKMWYDAPRLTAQDLGDLMIYADFYFDFKGVR